MSKPEITEPELYRLWRAIGTYLHDTYGTVGDWKDAVIVIKEHFEVKHERRSK